ncbi:MAG: hypothetical protein HY674_01085 [Chloroflexi bacterium]|nr:hypothetical protein [Chloroflexota bacterium]
MTRIYDLVMTHKLDSDDFFIHRVQQHCAERRLNFFLVEPLWVEPFLDRLARGQVWAKVLLNMHSEHHLPDEVYHRLVRLAAEKQTKVIDPPDAALAAFDKSRLHQRLVAAEFEVPPTILVPRAQADNFRLAEEDRVLLGTPFVIKPSLGYGRRGVILDATDERDLNRSMAGWEDPCYLLQRRIQPRSLNGSPLYFRVYFVFDSVWCCWWNCYTDRYRTVTAAEFEELGLSRLCETVRQVAQLTGMQFFSSEIAQTEKGEWVLIDYVNDQCHLLTQSANPDMGVPDELVAAIARRLVDGAQQLMAQAQ